MAKKTEVVFAKDTYKANDSLVIDGYSASQAFYKVKFKSKKIIWSVKLKTIS